jgi:hypothetical protein
METIISSCLIEIGLIALVLYVGIDNGTPNYSATAPTAEPKIILVEE